MLDRACAAKVVIYGHVSKTKLKPFQYGRTHYEVRLKSVVNRFPAIAFTTLRLSLRW